MKPTMATTKTTESTTNAHEAKAENPITQAADNWSETIREAGKAFADSASSIQDSNVQFAQSIIDQSFKHVEGQTMALHKLYTTLASHSAERRDALRQLAREATSVYISSLAAPVKFARRGLTAARAAVRQQAPAKE
jgi:hypothetical protein